MGCTRPNTARAGTRDGGFTLLEVLIVVVIIAILAAMAVPMYLGQRDKARVAGLQEAAHDLACGVHCFAVDNNGLYPADSTPLETVIGPDGPSPEIDDWPHNSWTGAHIDTTSSAEGEVTYALTPDGGFTLTPHGLAGETLAAR